MKHMLKLLVACIILCLSVQAGICQDKNELTVSAAISLKDAFQEIGAKFTGKTGVKVVFNFGASGALARQIEGGAPVDVFASAAQKDMNSVESKGFIMKDSRKDFVSNALALVSPKASTLGIAKFEDLLQDGVKRIAVGNPKTVPAGRYAAEALKYYGLDSKIKDKLIYTENVRQALDYVVRGEVDAGLVYTTDAATQKAGLHVVAIAPKVSHKPIVYPIAVVKDTKNKTAARAFVDLVLSGEGMTILKKYGFEKPHTK